MTALRRRATAMAMAASRSPRGHTRSPSRTRSVMAAGSSQSPTRTHQSWSQLLLPPMVRCWTLTMTTMARRTRMTHSHSTTPRTPTLTGMGSVRTPIKWRTTLATQSILTAMDSLMQGQASLTAHRRSSRTTTTMPMESPTRTTATSATQPRCTTRTGMASATRSTRTMTMTA